MGKMFDETGNKYGKWTVVKFSGNLPYVSKAGNVVKGQRTWLCLCQCGNERIISGASLRYGATTGCTNCTNHIDETGNKHGRLTVVKRAENDRLGKAMWLCRCDCGNYKIISGASLRRGKDGGARSCGCLLTDFLKSERLPRGEAAFNKLFYHYKRNARNRSYEWSIEKEKFREITKQKCFYCGDDPSSKAGYGRMHGEYAYNGLDRIDNKKGYYLNNILPCCSTCNRMKMDTSYEDFLLQIEKIYCKTMNFTPII